jgi:hypothetical protein
LGVAVFGLVTNHSHDMGLISLIIHSVTHGFAVNGQALILRGMDLIPTLQSPVQFDRIDPNQYIPDHDCPVKLF